MTRYYYTCPIKALYMMKEFGVQFLQWIYRDINAQKMELLPVRSRDFEDNIHCWNDKYSYENRFIVAPESEHIFKPKPYDLGIDNGSDVCEFQDCGEWTAYNDFRSNNPKNKEVKIIMRDNKQLFWPEVE